MIHNVLNVPSHSGQSTTDTIMQASSPSVTAPGGLTTNIQRCDEAAAQLEYGVGNSSSRFAACYDHIPNHGTLGLKTKLNITSPDLTKCLNQQMTFTGTLSVGLDGTNYKALSGQVLGGKTVRLERRPTSGGAWIPITSTITSSSGTYTFGVGYSSPQTWQFHTRFDGLSPSLDLKDSAEILTGSWATTC